MSDFTNRLIDAANGRGRGALGPLLQQASYRITALEAERDALRHDLERSMTRENERLQEVEALRDFIVQTAIRWSSNEPYTNEWFNAALAKGE